MKHLINLIIYGFISWFAPFMLSFLFFRNGNLTIEESFFKSIMIVTGSLTGVILLYLYFKNIDSKYLFNAFLAGIIWLIINLALDLLLVWRGLYQMTYQQYFQDIGLRYLSILIYALGLGLILHNKSREKEKRLD